MKSNRRSNINGFTIFLITYAVLLIGLIAFGLSYVWGVLIDYEASLPDVNMEKFMVEFQEENLSNLLDKFPAAISEYDDAENLKEAYVAMISGKELSFAKLTGRYTNATPVYTINSGEDVIAVAELTEVGKNDHGFSVWEMSNVIFDGYGPERISMKIKAPESAVVEVNDTVIDEKYLTGNESVEMISNISEYVERVPEYKIYEIDNLIEKPQIKVSGDYIKEVSEEGYNVSYTFDTDETLKQEVSGRITAMAREYGAYLINKGSLSALRSYMVGKAGEYVSNIPAIWAYLVNEEYSFNFTNENIDNFVRYSEDCFSCDVSFTLNVVYRGTRHISYDTKMSCMYVKQNGKWYLADFILRNADEDGEVK